MFRACSVDVFGAYHDDRHPSRGVSLLGLSVKVRLQFTCDLRHHVALKERVFLKKGRRMSRSWTTFHGRGERQL